MIHLVRFKLAAYARSHRLLQPMIGLTVMLIHLLLHADPAGQGAVLLRGLRRNT